jgi:hypothetical protein
MRVGKKSKTSETRTSYTPRKCIRTAQLGFGRLHEVHTILAIEWTPDVSGTFEDLTELFEVLVHIFLFDGVAPFLLGGHFLCAGTA